MRKTRGVLGLMVAVAVGASASPLLAQRGPGPRGQGGPNMGRSVDVVLEHQEALGLTEQQISQLQQLKADVETDVAPLAEEMQALRAQIRDGTIDRTEGFRQMEALRGEMITAAAPLRGRVQEILTVEQHNELRALMRQGRRGPGRAGAPWARGMSGGRGMLPGRGRAGGQPWGPGRNGVLP